MTGHRKTIQYSSRTAPPMRGLSSFAPTPFEARGRAWPTAEHLYQAGKALAAGDEALAERIRAARSGAEARFMGRIPEPPGWSPEGKLRAKAEALAARTAQDPGARALLLSTGDAELVHVVTWNDPLWGRSPSGKGLNLHGEMLMAIRDALRAGGRSEADLAEAALGVACRLAGQPPTPQRERKD